VRCDREGGRGGEEIVEVLTEAAVVVMSEVEVVVVVVVAAAVQHRDSCHSHAPEPTRVVCNVCVDGSRRSVDTP
jgi:hypothetical protein